MESDEMTDLESASALQDAYRAGVIVGPALERRVRRQDAAGLLWTVAGEAA